METNYAYDANDRLIWEETQKANNILATTEYFYDANGNQISKLFNDLTDQSGAAASISMETQADTPNYEYWEYDGFNRLIAYHNPTTSAGYTYNTEGLRITKKVNGQETKHIWDGSNMVMELNGSDQIIDKYIRGNKLIKSDLNGYYLHNAHGDVIQLADQQGIVTRSYLYDAFGVEQETQPNDTNLFRYCEEYLDKESGVIYLRARYYDPTTGRFLSEDAYKGTVRYPLSLNLYTYCNNNPINMIDPTGHDPVGLRTFANANGYSVSWDTSTRTATISRGNEKSSYSDGVGGTYIDSGGNMIVNSDFLPNASSSPYTQNDKAAGVKMAVIDGKQYLDITTPLNKALAEIGQIAKTKLQANFPWYISQVNHGNPWDIKREDPWTNTIGTSYPGNYDTPVVLFGEITTPEKLGNITYGYIGAAQGYSLDVLYTGSWVAAGFPTSGNNLANEYNDRVSIEQGYNWWYGGR